MLRKFFLGSLFVMSTIVLYAARITVHIDYPRRNLPVLYLPNGESLQISMNADGDGEVSLSMGEAGYVKIVYEYVTRLFWLTPTSTLNLSFVGSEYYKDVHIEGDNAEINRYLNDGTLAAMQINDAQLEEHVFIQKSDSLLRRNLENLKQKKLPPEFSSQEVKRLRYYVNQTLPIYPLFHRRIIGDKTYEPSSAYWDKLGQILEFNGDLLALEDYQSFLLESVRAMSSRLYPELKGIQRLIAFIDSRIDDKRISEYLVYRSTYAYVKKHGMEGADPYLKAYKNWVTSDAYKARVEQLCLSLESLQVGALSPDFNATNVEGEKVSLVGLRGKYVYIDIWATWCAPCRKEIPYMQKLEQKFHGANIYFVSLSCDSDRKAWERKVKDGTHSGLQLHLSDDSFMKKYMVQGIPHFILLDPEGKIVSSKMTRPSDPATESLLNQILNNQER